MESKTKRMERDSLGDEDVEGFHFKTRTEIDDVWEQSYEEDVLTQGE
jgi:hypothetical protein